MNKITDSHPLHLLNEFLRIMENTEKSDHPLVNYDEDIDELWLVLDRDPGNFSAEQFDKVYQKCEEEGIHIGFTNAKIEFWLLLHLPEIEDYDKKELLENKNVNKNKRYI
ncbi:RloB domain-containing protein [Oceanobacillus salinisoli]|uniref:RloB domain-containing protein n=1 Tax=Oceanobacillus salinisoli TaxID=2678611 RepID=UPI0022AF25D6|nr:RloB domain-containing protein [Oceanobacillus salinisoli]